MQLVEMIDEGYLVWWTSTTMTTTTTTTDDDNNENVDTAPFS